MAIQTLEGFIEPDELKVVHVGGPVDRFRLGPGREWLPRSGIG
ncbi:hypothetical protein AB0M34_34860 [Nocardia sp. NPDC050193]